MSLVPRFHRAEKNSIESDLEASVTAINETVTHPECKTALTAMLCHYTIPPCSANNSMTQFCISECSELFTKCGHYIDQLEAARNLIPGGKEFRLSFRNCFGLNNSELDEGHEPCIKLGLSKYRSVHIFSYLVYTSLVYFNILIK